MMPELLIVHEFARRVATYIISDTPCMVIFNAQDLQEKKNIGQREQNFLIHDINLFT